MSDSPGGLVLCVEPNNSVQSLLRDSLSHSPSIDETLDNVRYALIWEAGKRALGEGHNSCGDFLAEFFHQSGLIDIRVYLSDKTSPLIPPYDSPDQQALISTAREWVKENSGPNDDVSENRYFDVFDGKYSEFLDSFRRKSKQVSKDYWAQIDSQKFITAEASR